MKKNSIKSFILLLCALLIAACSGNKVTQDAYLNVIPGDAMVVAKVELGNLLKKSDIQNNTFVKMGLEREIAEMPEKEQALLKEIFNNPAASGIDVNAPVYVTVLNLEPVKLLVTAKMGNASTFENTVSTFLEDEFKSKEKDGMTCLTPLDEDFYVSGEPTIEIAYDADKVLIVLDEGGADLQTYLALENSKKAVNDKKFAKLFKCSEDVAYVVNYTPLVEYMIENDLVERDLVPFVAMAKENVAFCSLDFKNGCAELKSSQELPAEYRELFKTIAKKSTRRHFDYIPANSFALMSYNFNLKQLFTVLEACGLQKELAKSGVSKDVAEEFLTALSGDYTLASWANGKDVDDIQFMLAVDCSDRSLFDLLIAYAQFALGATIVDEDVYSFDLMDYYLMYKDNSIMVMPENLYNKVCVKGKLQPLKKNLKSNELFAAAQNDIVVDFKPVREMLVEYISYNASSRPQEDAMSIDLLNTIDNITVDTNIDNACFKVNTANANVNSLKFVLDKIISSAVRNSLIE